MTSTKMYHQQVKEQFNNEGGGECGTVCVLQYSSVVLMWS